ncbi:MAG: hypothetical protein LLG01_11140 [Planctomycetaceae bacterium]|nr:hypothetical protein [Planctomycetaceae bacterium]
MMQNPENHGYATVDHFGPALKPVTVYWQWILMNALIWPGMMILATGAGFWLQILVGSWGLSLGFVIINFLAGLLQAAVVHSRLPRLRWWHWAAAQCAAAACVYITISTSTSPLDTCLDRWYEVAALAGLAAGVCQWFVLRRYATRAYWWIPANVIAALLGVGAIVLSLSIQSLVGVFLAGAVTGATHGIVLAWVIQPRDC